MAATKQQSSSVNTGGSNYLPVFSLDGDGPHAANRDPLYAAMLNVPSPSINILNTIDEPIIDTIVTIIFFIFIFIINSYRKEM